VHPDSEVLNHPRAHDDRDASRVSGKNAVELQGPTAGRGAAVQSRDGKQWRK